jgi:hypothetical protein
MNAPRLCSQSRHRTPTAAHLDEALHTLDQLRCGDRVAYREFALALFRTTALPFELPDAPRGNGAAPAASASVHRIASVAAASEMGAGAWRGPVGLHSPNGSAAAATAAAAAVAVSAPAPASAPPPRDEMTSLAALLRSAGQSAPGAASAAMNLTSLLASLTSYEGSARGEPSARASGEAVGRAP